MSHFSLKFCKICDNRSFRLRILKSESKGKSRRLGSFCKDGLQSIRNDHKHILRAVGSVHIKYHGVYVACPLHSHPLLLILSRD